MRPLPQVVSAAAEAIRPTLPATTAATVVMETPMLTAATTVGIRIRKVPRIHTVLTTEAPVESCFEYAVITGRSELSV